MSLLFDDSLRKIGFLFKYSGLNFERTIRNTIGDIITFRWLFILNFFWLNTDTAGEIFWMIDGAYSGKRFVELTFVAPCMTISLLSNIKILVLIHNEEKIKCLFKNLRAMENFNGDNDVKSKIVDEEKRFLMVFISALNFWNAMTVIAFSLSPLLPMALAYKETGQVELVLPFLIVYPFDAYKIKYWPFVYLHQIWSACVAVLGIGAADCLFYTCCTCIRTQFRLLQHDIESIIPEGAFEEGVFQEKFKKLVARHEEIFQSVTLLETIYKRSTLFNFVSSSFLICLTGFNVTAIDDLAFVMSFVTFLLMSLLQIFLLCFFGDMIMTSSLEVSNAMYNSNWYSVNAKIAKQLFLVQIRSQKPCKLTASSYADVNLRAFTKILSTAWSYFALLNTIYSSPRAESFSHL